MSSKVLAFVLLAACFAATVAAFPEQSVCTFTPPNPGFLHNDRFSVLDNDRVRVDRFNAPQLAAGVLDFRNSDVSQTVTLGLTGGIAFDSESVSLASGGSGAFASGSSLSINALLGSVDFLARDDVVATASGGDFDLDSQDGNVNLNANNDLIIEAAQVLFDGKYESLGVSFSTTTGGDITLRAGDLEEGATGFGNIDIKGSDVTMSAALLTLQSVDNGLTVSSQGNQVYAGETMSLGATDTIDVTSDLADVVVDSGANTSVNGAAVSFEAGNRARLRSVHGNVGISATGDVGVVSRDHVHLIATGAEPLSRDASDCDGVSIVARDSIALSAVKNVDLIAQGTNGVTVTAGSLELTSDLGDVILGSEETDTVSIAATGDAEVDANDSIKFSAQGLLAVGSLVGTSFDASDVASFSAGEELSVSAGNNFELNFDRYFGEFSLDAEFSGDGVAITVDDFDVSAGNNVEIEADNNAEFFFSDLVITGEEFVTLAGDDVIVNLNDDLTVVSDGNINFSSESTDGQIEFVLNGNFAVDGDHGDHEFYGTSMEIVAGQQAASVDSGISSHSFVKVRAGNAASFSADEDVNVEADDDLVIDNESFSSTSVGATRISADNDVHVNAQDTITMSTATGTAATTQTYRSGDSVHITGGEFVEFNAADFTLEADAVYFQTRDPLGFFATNSVAVDASSTSNFNSASTVEFNGDNFDLSAGEDFTMTATDNLGAEIRFGSNAGSITMTAEDDVSHIGARHVIEGGSVDFVGATVAIEQDGPFGRVAFQAAGAINVDADTDIRVGATNAIFAAENDVSFTATDEFIVTPATLNEINVQAGTDVTFTSNADILFQNDIIDITYLNDADFDIGGDVTITSQAGVFINGADFINVEVDGAVNVDTLDELTVTATESTSLTGGMIDITGSVSLDLISGGGGFVNTADRNIVFRTTDLLTSTTTDDNHFVSETGDVLVNADGDLTVSGGNSTYTAQEDITFTSEGTMAIQTSRFDFHALQHSPGNVLLHSGNSFVENDLEGLFSLAHAGPTYPIDDMGNNPSNFADGGGNAHIAATAEGADVCLQTIDEMNGETIFTTAEDMLVSAHGDGSSLELFADGQITNEAGASIGLSANGFTTDSFNLVDDNIGVLFRAARGDATGSIAVDAAAAGVSIFGQTGFSVTAQDSFDVTASETINIQADGHDADVSLFSTDGAMTFTVSDDTSFVAGTHTSIGNINLNSTDTQTWTVDDLFITQIGANTDVTRDAITIESFGGPLEVTAPGGLAEFFANQDGGISGSADNGDINITADDEVRLAADTGLVHLEGQAGAVLDTTAGTDDIQINSAGSITLESAGGENLSITSLTTRLFFTAENGEVELKSTNDLTVTAVNDVDLDGPCAAVVGGGSVELISEGNIDLTSAQDIRFDADVELTADATAAFTVTADEVIINAGGDQSTSGISIQSGGEVDVDATQVILNALSTVMQADTDFVIASTAADVRVTSTAPSGTNDNFLVEALNGNLDFDATGTLQIAGERENTVDAGGVVTFTADSALVLSARETLSVVRTDYTVTTVADITLDQASGLWDVAGDIVATALDLTVASDYALSISADELMLTADAAEVSFLAGISTDITFETEGDFVATSVVTATITADNKLDVDGTDSVALDSALITFTAEDDFIVSAFGAISAVATASYDLTASENINLSSVEDTTTLTAVAGAFTANPMRTLIDSVEDMTFTAVDIAITAPDDTQLVFVADRGALTLSGGITYAPTAVEDVRFVGDDLRVSADNILYTLPATATVGAPGGSIVLDVPEFTTDAALTSFAGSGEEGTRFDIDGDFDVAAPIIRAATDGGNIHLSSGETNGVSVTVDDTATFLSAGPSGDILIEAVNIPITADNIEIGSRADASGTLGEGLVSLTASNRIEIDATTADLASESDVRFVAQGITVTGDSLLTEVASANIKAARGDIDADNLVLSTVGAFSDVVLSATRIESGAEIAQLNAVAAEHALLQSSGQLLIDGSDLTLASGDHMLFRAGNAILLEPLNDPSGVDVTGAGNTLAFDSSDIGSSSATFDADEITITGNTDVDIRSKDLVYLEATEVEAPAIDFVSANDVWFNGASINIGGVGTTQITFGTQGAGNFNMYTNELNMDADAFLFEARGDLGLIGGRYTANSRPLYPYADAPRNFQVNIDGIEARNVNGNLFLTATDNVNIQSFGGSIEIRGTYDIAYDASRTNGHIGFFGVLETLPNFGQFIGSVGFDFEVDYCATVVGGGDRCDLTTNCASNNNVGCLPTTRTCTVTCPELSDVVNDIARMLVAYNLVACDNDPGFCCVFPNC